MASAALANARITLGDFQFVTANADEGDLIYFDPPYTVAHANNGFVKYNERIFSWADQVRLAKHARRLASRGCAVVISNADHPSIREIYEGFEVTEISRHSIISASKEHRRVITECIFSMNGESGCD